MIVWVVLLLIVVARLVYSLLKWLYTSALIWTQVSFSLLVGWLFAPNFEPFVENGFLNTLCFAGIAFVCIFLLSMIDRVDCAIKYGSTLMVTFLVNAFCIAIGNTILQTFFSVTLYEGGDMTKTWVWPVLLIGTIGFTVWMTLGELLLLAPCWDKEKNPIVEMTERIVASAIYGFFTGMFILFAIGTGGNEFFPVIYMIISAAVAFLADYFLMDRFVKAACEIQEEEDLI